MNYKYELELFLNGTFHQDIQSPEIAVKEYMKDEDDEFLYETIEIIDKFLKSKMTIEEKNLFIIKNTEIYFRGLEKEPIEWLKEVNETLKHNHIIK